MPQSIPFWCVIWALAGVQGKARPDGSPKDIDREFVLMYSIAHERRSFFALGNYLRFLPQLADTAAKKRTLADELAEDDSDDYGDIYYTINGAPRCMAWGETSADTKSSLLRDIGRQVG